MVILIKDYLDELKNYLYILKKKFNKFIRKCKYFFHKLFSKEYRTTLIAIGVLFIIVNLIILFNYTTMAFYQDVYNYSIIQSKVGDFSVDADYILLVYIESINSQGEGSGKYTLTSSIPTSGYTYSGYKCKNNSTLIYDDVLKTTTVTIAGKESCSIYFDLTNTADITISIMIEEEVGSNTYKITDSIPYYGYEYSYYECTYNSTLTYDSDNHLAVIESTTKDYCSIYFTKNSSDIEVNLYIENTSGNYIKSTSIPQNKTYSLDTENTTCVNNEGTSIYDVVSYIDGYITVTTEEIVYCDVYLELAND